MSEHRVFLEYDPDMKRTVWLIFDDKGNITGAHIEQEVDDILAANHDARVQSAEHGRLGDYNRIASVPLTFLEKTGLGDAINAQDRRFLSKLLNDPDNAMLRTSRGRV